MECYRELTWWETQNNVDIGDSVVFKVGYGNMNFAVKGGYTINNEMQAPAQGYIAGTSVPLFLVQQLQTVQGYVKTPGGAALESLPQILLIVFPIDACSQQASDDYSTCVQFLAPQSNGKRADAGSICHHAGDLQLASQSSARRRQEGHYPTCGKASLRFAAFQRLTADSTLLCFGRTDDSPKGIVLNHFSLSATCDCLGASSPARISPRTSDNAPIFRWIGWVVSDGCRLAFFRHSQCLALRNLLVAYTLVSPSPIKERSHVVITSRRCPEEPGHQRSRSLPCPLLLE
jgi:hypothetical protein